MSDGEIQHLHKREEGLAWEPEKCAYCFEPIEHPRNYRRASLDARVLKPVHRECFDEWFETQQSNPLKRIEREVWWGIAAILTALMLATVGTVIACLI